MSENPLPLIDPDEEKVHLLYRERIVQEDNLINHRMMWMILSQAFMLALWGVVLNVSKNTHLKEHVILGLIELVGGILALSVKMPIAAAQSEIAVLRKKYSDLYESAASRIKIGKCRAEGILPSLTASERFHWLGHLTPSYMPIILMLLGVCSLILRLSVSLPQSRVIVCQTRVHSSASSVFPMRE